MTERALEVSVELTKTNHPRKTKISTEATMAVDHPSSVIRDLQIQLRKEAGVASYDPDDPSLLSSGLPSLEDLIAGLDPSPDYLRCRRCRGRLLRGVRSTICVFCGADRSGEASASAEISFNTTAAYRHLIESLGLDGSEPVMVNTSSTESNRGRRNASKDGLVLSDILDFKMQWPMESEKKENTNAGKAPTHGIYPLNLSGADLDNFFSKTETNAGPVPTGSSPEQLLPKKENHTSVPESSGLFGEIQSSNSVTRSMDSKESESAETVTVWEADFQSASFETRPVESKLDDPFSGIPVNYSANPLSTAVHSIPSKDIEIDYKIKDDDGNTEIDEPHHSSSSDNQIQDDIWDTMSARVADEQEQSSKRDSRTNGDEQKSSSPTCDDWFTDNLFPPSSSKALTLTNSSNQNDDVSDDWQDFASSVNNAPGGVETGIENENNSSIAEVDQERKILNNSASVQDDWFQDQLFSASNITTPKHTEIGGENDSPLDDWQCLTSSGVPPPMKISEGIIHDDQLDDWQDFTSSENMPHSNVEKTNENSNKAKADDRNDGLYNNASMRDDWFQEHPSPMNSTIDDEHMDKSHENDDSSDVWQDFTTSVPTPPKEDDPLNTWDGFASSGGIPTKNAEKGENVKPSVHTLRKEDDPLDTWQDFASSGNSSTPPKHIEKSESVKPSVQMLPKENDPVDTWQDFASLGSTPPKHVEKSDNDNPSVQMLLKEEDPPDAWQDFASSGSTSHKHTEKSENDKPSVQMLLKEEDPLDAWQDFASSGSTSHKHIEKSENDKPSVQTLPKEDDPLDAWQDFTSSGSTPPKHIEKSENDKQLGSWQSFPSLGHAPSKTMEEKDDPFSVWQDLTILVHEPPKNMENNVGGGASSNAWQDLTGFGHAQPKKEEKSVAQDSLDSWQGFTSAGNPPKEVKKGTGNEDAVDDWQGFTNAGETLPKNAEKGMEADDPLDAWQDYTSSGNPQPKAMPESIVNDDSLNSWPSFMSSGGTATKNIEKSGGFADPLDFWQGFTSSVVVPTNTTERSTENVDPLDAWKDFSSFGVTIRSSSTTMPTGSHITQPNERASESKSGDFNDDSEDMEFGSFQQ